jgi:hypothetical protein
MGKAPGVSSGEPVRAARRPAGLVGYRYVLAVALLVVLAWAPMAAAVIAGTEALSAQSPPTAGPATAVSYPDLPGGGAGSAACRATGPG